MQAVQNWLNAGNMALLDVVYIVAIGTLLAILYVWWRFGLRFILPTIVSSALGLAGGIFSGHLFYLFIELPYYIGKNYLWYPLGFYLPGYIAGHIVSVFTFAFLISFFSPYDAEIMVITALLSLPLLFPTYLKLILVVMGLLLLLSIKKYLSWMKTLALLLFSLTAVVYNVMWTSPSGEIMALSVGGIVVSTMLALWVFYRGDRSGL